MVDKTSIIKTNNVEILQSINHKAAINDVYIKSDLDIGLNLTSGKFNKTLKADVDVFFYILQAGIDRRVLIHAVDINGKFKLNATSNDILKIQKVDGSTLYDSLELSFNTVDKTSISKGNNVDILAS